MFSGVLILALVILISLYAFLFFRQKSLIFYPTKLSDSYTFQFSSPFEERWLQPNALRIHSLYFRTPNPRGVILYFHGNGGALDNWGHVGAELADKTKFDVWIVDYPGYGKSEGAIVSEEQLHSIATTMYDELPEPKPRVIAYGRSIGTGIASRLAAKKPIAGLILETPYWSLRTLVGEMLPWVPGFLVQFQFLNNEFILETKAPVLILHGTQDEVIPFSHGKRLAELAPATTRFVEIPGGRHNDLPQYKEYWQSVTGFLADK